MQGTYIFLKAEYFYSSFMFIENLGKVQRSLYMPTILPLPTDAYLSYNQHPAQSDTLAIINEPRLTHLY